MKSPDRHQRCRMTDTATGTAAQRTLTTAKALPTGKRKLIASIAVGTGRGTAQKRAADQSVVGADGTMSQRESIIRGSAAEVERVTENLTAAETATRVVAPRETPSADVVAHKNPATMIGTGIAIAIAEETRIKEGPTLGTTTTTTTTIAIGATIIVTTTGESGCNLRMLAARLTLTCSEIVVEALPTTTTEMEIAKFVARAPSKYQSIIHDVMC